MLQYVPQESVRKLLDSDLLTPVTQRVLQSRLQSTSADACRFLTKLESATLTALARCLLAGNPAVAIAAAIREFERGLKENRGCGWRYASLPPNRDLQQQGLAAVEGTAWKRHGCSFHDLGQGEQITFLQELRGGGRFAAPWQELPVEAWFDSLLSALAAACYSHPLAQERIGFAGMADAKGWQAINLNQREKWEASAVGEDQEPQFVAHSPRKSPAIEMPTLTATDKYDPADPVDAVVIGTGAGGAVVLARLAAAGLRTVALEAGGAWNAATDFATDEAAQQDLYWRYERLIAGTNPLKMGQNNSGIGVGGSTLHYTGFVPRAHPDDFCLHAETGKGIDWPLRYEDLAPFYERVEQFIGVSGPPDYPWGPPRNYPLPSLPLNGAAELMKRGCDALGIKSAPAPNAALSRRYYRPEIGWRSACINRGFCECGCRTGARGSMDVTYLPYALQSGAEIRPECFVVGFDMERNGCIRAVRYRHQGQVYRQRCRHVFLCAGAVETPRLLLSAGLSNSSGQVGCNLMAHPGLQVWGRFAEMVRPYKGFPCTLISEEMHRPASAEFAGGYLLQSLGVIPLKYVAKLTGRGIWGKALFEHMTHFNQVAGINIAGECLPYARNRISLSAERDETGLRKPLITFSYGDNELRLLQHAEAVMRRIMTAAGARDMWLNPRQAHVLGTCRMGNNAAEAVVDSWGQSYDVPNLRIVDSSLFPSATAVNPTLTILALAERAAAQFVQTQA